MIELLRTNDLVLISLIESIFADRGIDVLVADQHMSVLEGSAGFLQRRLLVPRDQASRARFALREAGLEGELRIG
jgi:hypothetical protein